MGLVDVLKVYGQIDCTDVNGKKVSWLYDHVADRPRLKSEMTKEEISASEKAKWEKIKEGMLKL